MIQPDLKISRVLALAIAGFMTAMPALADKDSRGGNKHEKHEQKEKHGGHDKHDRDNDHRNVSRRFDDRQRTIINNYYTQEFRSGHCPPGLAKKHNGCVPPGQRRWAIGRRLPPDVIFYDLPPAVIGQLGVPLQDYRYVRVANDILMISIGTGLVIDAIQDLGR
ncbi:MAG: hypothetical protein ACXW1Z_21105 [Methylobacter sp.]